jgi:Dyp-type peroxidase family
MAPSAPPAAEAKDTSQARAASAASWSAAPIEPVLEMPDIQGIVVPGFFKPHQTLLSLRLPDNVGVLNQFRNWLRNLKPSNAEETLHDRRQFRNSTPGSKERSESDARVFAAIGFSYAGLLRLTPGAFSIQSEAFRHGMESRSKLLGDPADPKVEGHPSTWVVGGVGRELDALVVVAGGLRDRVSERAAALAGELSGIGVDVESQDGDTRTGAEAGHEHFGFADGVSQPGIRGLASASANDYITDRDIRPEVVPAAWLYGAPGQDLVWPGEFVLGYPATSPDPLLPGRTATLNPPWTRNGSFLAYRRLRQDVGLFWRAMRAEAARLAALPGFSGMTDDRLAALLVGRWPSGAPVNRSPMQDDKNLGDANYANNNIRFDSDAPIFDLVSGTVDRFPRAKADPAGTTCPWAAHIRKVNVRDSSSDMGARSSTLERRILRVGVPFGKSLADRYAQIGDDPQKGQRGLLFLSIQTSIEEQFEFLQARWINDESRPKMPGGNDMIVGQNAPTRDGVRRCMLFGGGLAQAEVSSAAQWVIPTGGGYFFVPSLSALRDILTTP